MPSADRRARDLPGGTRRLVTLGLAASLSVCAVWYGHATVARVATASPGVAVAAALQGGSSRAAVAAPAPMSPSATEAGAQPGDLVTVDFTGTLADEQVFDSSQQSGPLTFTVGAGEVIPGFDHAVVGLRPGQTVQVQVPPVQGFGERDSSLVVTVPIAQAPAGLQVGQQVRLGGRPAVVTQITSTGVTVDANPPLAGQTLTFKITMVSITPQGRPPASPASQ